MSNRLPRLTLISSASPLAELPNALRKIRDQNGNCLEVWPFFTHQLQEPTLLPETFLSQIRQSDAVLFDLRGNPDRAVSLVQQALVETSGEDIAFIPVFGGGPSILALTRMGDFSMAGMVAGRSTGHSTKKATEKSNDTKKETEPDRPSVSGANNSAASNSATKRRETDGSSGTDYRQLKQAGQGIERMASNLPPHLQRHAKNWATCMQYWTNSGADNLANLFRFVAREYGGLAIEVDEPAIYPNFGFLDWHTRERYASYSDYVEAHPLNPARPTVALLVYGETSLAANLSGGQELFEELAKAANVLPFFADGIGTADAIEQHFIQNDQPICDAIVSMLWFRLDGGPLGGDGEKTVQLLKRLDVPYYVAITSNNREVALWEQSLEGLPPVETLATVAFPELDGAIDPVLVYGLAGSDAAAGQITTPVKGRGRRLAGRILKRIALKHKTNAEKRVAVVIFNYPPSEGTLGSASFLDVFASVERTLLALQEEGYAVTPPAPETLKKMFLERGLLHNGEFTSTQVSAKHAIRVPLQHYLSWYAQLPESLRQSTEAIFGEPPGDLMVNGEDILIAGIEFGNVVVAVQPSRGIHEDPSKIHHDDTLPAHHQYYAFYRWLEASNGWQADAVVHVGTHGTFEFLPGKQVALGADSAPDAMLGNLPNLYLYHVMNVSEGTIAKRRSYAQLISYASPTFAPAGLYEHLSQLEDAITEYDEQRAVSVPRCWSILKQVLALCDQHDVPLDLSDELKQPLHQGDMPGEAAALETAAALEPYEAALEQLHIDLFDLKRVAIPLGLHTFGQRLSGEGLVDYLNLVARYDRPESPSLPRLLAQRQGWSYDQLLDEADAQVEALADESRALITQLVNGSTRERLAITATDLSPALTYLNSVLSQIEATQEMNSLLHALDGGYVEPGLGGDPVRSPFTYPTGRNTYQFDPTKLPTDSAYERGAQIAEETLDRYVAEKGTYPDAVGVILWGFETCKTYGETIGQVLRYIGVRVERGQGYFMKPVVIPLAELGRPRVDVTVNICGFFRDLFPNLVRLIDLAFQTVAKLDEPLEMNAVRRHAEALLPQLAPELESPMASSIENQQLAAARIFGPPPGEYGNGLSTLIETAAWEDESDLGRLFIQRTQYVYGDRIAGYESQQAFESALGRTQVVTQVRDSHEFEVTDIDHYYEFFGGMAQAATLISGDRPDVLIADTTQERIQVKTIQAAVRQGVTSRLLNPKWIDAMLEHDHKGAQGIADRLEYLVGLEATTRSVGAATWRKVAQRFVFDPAMRDRLRQNNPYATAEIVQKLGEAEHRGYWQPTATERQQLEEGYHDIEQQIEFAQM
ncbi:magnesium chelatase subunit H [cf. Phormidesmis sp. LEGE 11477]|uniref:magnesium chelatase subunit H n=1 Tax=cf. Phormidesmis sp. LEGE 11477 TaxID=1828680 RepID=UPI001881B87B|nr:magnesium chelatase subunit H [cf. Phormidesmis sp. LEGE 11477]MBE9061123.1 magnesium chelatase subunit H [cf. Phormidesmis sp. LEGE 11477]